MRLLSTGLLASVVAAAVSLPVVSVATAKEKPPQEWDGLERRPSKRLDNVYVRPNVQFKAYKRVRLDPVDVQFDKDWDPNSGSRMLTNRLSKDEIQDIRTGLAELFRDEFGKHLAKGGYMLVDTNDEDVLRVQAALVNLYINAPETNSASRTRSYTMDAGRVTLVMQLADSVTGQTLARVVDTQQGLDTGRLTWTTSVSNSAEARRIVGIWSDQLRKALDRVNGRKSPSERGHFLHGRYRHAAALAV
jgi:hypothetical protein